MIIFESTNRTERSSIMSSSSLLAALSCWAACCTETVRTLYSIVSLDAGSASGATGDKDHQKDRKDEIEDISISSNNNNNSNRSEVLVKEEDVWVVMRKLGMVEDDEDDGETGLAGSSVEAALRLLEEKEAEESEMEEAFYVFDRDEDGFITAEELWGVLRRLGMAEGARLEDCRRMIRAFDVDGDGRLDAGEFRRMLEGAS